MESLLLGAVVQRTASLSGPQEIIPRADLRPGDVLLSCGRVALSELIRRIDGGLYSHAAMWDGERSVDTTPSGIKRNTLDDVIAAQWYIDAYRWHMPPKDPGNYLGTPAYPSEPVLNETASIVRRGADFAYDQLLLGAMIISISKRPDDKWDRASVRLLLSRFQVWVGERIKKPGRTKMVCSETVARSFGEAAKPPDYTIQVIVDGSRDTAAIAAAVRRDRAISADGAPPPPVTPPKSYDAVKQQYAELLVSTMTEDEKERLLEFAELNADGGANTTRRLDVGDRGVPFQCVSPRDLERSPNLEFIGRLSEKRTPDLPESSFALFVRMLRDFAKSKMNRAANLDTPEPLEGFK